MDVTSDIAFLLIVVIASFICWSQESSITPPDPELVLNFLKVEVNETQRRQTNLSPSGPLLSCTDEDPARAYIISVTPTSPCGRSCFLLSPCGTSRREFCLYFLPSQGTLDYSTVPEYTVTIGCTDDVEPVTSKSVTVGVVPNSPPVFDTPDTSTAVDGVATQPSDILYDVKAKDADGDPLCYNMSTTPATTLLEIGQSNGAIHATNDLRLLCTNSIQANVTVTDKRNPPIGPLTIDFNINPYNEPPTVTNLDRTVAVDENVGVDYVVARLDVEDRTVYPSLSFYLRSDPHAGLEAYKLVHQGGVVQIKTKINPNYERNDTRNVTLYIEVSDGYCKSPTYSLTINIVDVNEPPRYYPAYVQFIHVHSGYVRFPTGLRVVDEDLDEVHTHSKRRGSHRFGVRSSTGNIYSYRAIHIPRTWRSQNFWIQTQVTDKGGLTAKALIRFTVFEANNRRPIFVKSVYSFPVTACTELGSVLGTVEGKDYNTDYNNNNVIYFGGGGDKLVVMSGGAVVLTKFCTDGETLTGTATIHDQGIYPTSYSGDPARLSLTCGPCPTASTTTTASTTATSAPATSDQSTATTTASPTTVTAVLGNDTSTENQLLWLVPVIVGGVSWLSVTGFVIFRFCCHWRNPFTGCCTSKPKPLQVGLQPRQSQGEEPSPQRHRKVGVAPPIPQIIPPTPEPSPPTERKHLPNIFRFRKEDSSDQTNQLRLSRLSVTDSLPSVEVTSRDSVASATSLRISVTSRSGSRTSSFHQTSSAPDITQIDSSDQTNQLRLSRLSVTDSLPSLEVASRDSVTSARSSRLSVTSRSGSPTSSFHQTSSAPDITQIEADTSDQDARKKSRWAFRSARKDTLRVAEAIPLAHVSSQPSLRLSVATSPAGPINSQTAEEKASVRRKTCV